MKMKNRYKKIMAIGIIFIMLASMLIIANSSISTNNENNAVPDSSNATFLNYTFVNLPSNQLVVVAYMNQTILDLMPMSEDYALNGTLIPENITILPSFTVNVSTALWIGNTNYINTFSGKADIQITVLPYYNEFENVTSLTPRTTLCASPNALTDGYFRYLFFNDSEYIPLQNYIKSATFTSPVQFMNDMAKLSNPYITATNDFTQLKADYDYIVFVNNNTPSLYTITITGIPANYIITSANSMYNSVINNGTFTAIMLQFTYGNVTFSDKNNSKTFYFNDVNSNITTNWNSTSYIIPVNFHTVISRTDLSYMFIVFMFIVLLITVRYTNYTVTDITGFLMFFIGYSMRLAYFNLISLTVIIFLMALYTTLKLLSGGDK